MNTFAVFGSGKCNSDSEDYQIAFQIGERLASCGFSIVNGGYNGIMEATFKGASKYNTERIGVVFENFKSFPNKFCTKVIKTNSYIERLEKLLDLADSYIFLYGGSGTLLEFSAVAAYIERGFFNKRVFAIDNKLLDLLDKFNINCNVIKFDTVDDLLIKIDCKNGTNF